jgi:pimeloyl-ACP methyl ester carboxylesterase
MAASRRPFHRLPFAALPELPSRPHPYFDAPMRTLAMTSAALGPITIHYREHGEGEPLLLIHGLMTSSYSWRYVLAALGARFRVIAPDLPGAGRSDAPKGRFDAAALAAWIGEFQAALGIEGCLAVGNSLGGYLCMRHALAAPRAFARLCNIHSPALPLGRFYALHALLSAPGAPSLLSWWVRRAPERWAHQNVHYYDETLKSLEEARVYGAPLARPDGARAFVGYLRDVMAPSGFAEFVATLRARKAAGQPFPMPLQLIYSRQDPLVPPQTGAVLHELVDGSELTWLEDTSHFAHVDSPERVAPLLIDFLTRDQLASAAARRAIPT